MEDKQLSFWTRKKKEDTYQYRRHHRRRPTRSLRSQFSFSKLPFRLYAIYSRHTDAATKLNYPIPVSKPYQHEPEKTWPSSYANNAQVTWSKAIADDDGNLAVSFPSVKYMTSQCVIPALSLLTCALDGRDSGKRKDGPLSNIIPF